MSWTASRTKLYNLNKLNVLCVLTFFLEPCIVSDHRTLPKKKSRFVQLFLDEYGISFIKKNDITNTYYEEFGLKKKILVN